MKAEEVLRAGDSAAALAALQERVRSDPSDAKLRVFLFQLLAIEGQWDRALNQLNVAGELDTATLAMVQTYREALRCEVLRADVFAGKRTPLLFGEPAEWMALMLEALRMTAQGHHAQARSLRERAFEDAPVTPGKLDGQEFEWIADADTRVGPMLEAVLEGRYYWIPFHVISEIRVEEPADLRDFVWLPAQFAWTNGGQAVGLIPTRYPGSEHSDNPTIRLARRTEWMELDTDVFLGSGQRMLATDTGEHPLMDVREVTLTVSAPAD